MKITEKPLKKDKLRYNEYYNTQETFDDLYAKSKAGYKFKNLYQLIIKEENILLAFRNIKRNSGSTTPGTNNRNIKFWENVNPNDYIEYIRSRLNNYEPMKVKRVEIPKPDGSKRPLGIPCIEDRLIQQCIKQILEPICEAKFHKHSYGFRPNRSTEHAIAYLLKKINLDKCYYIVDIDIKGFFDNVNHSKLIKQLWSMGIQDKKLISIIKAMLKAEIDGIGIPTKGVPQGDILSPLLSNIVLNELDWWISSQWETFKTDHEYTSNNNKYQALKQTSNMKEIFIVRYADDFKICCRTEDVANRIFIATRKWLKERLDLDISEKKSKITNVNKYNTEFLGFKLKLHDKGRKKIIKSHMTDKAMKSVEDKLRKQIKEVQHCPTYKEVNRLNTMISGFHNYYKIATEVSKDFSIINYNLSECMKKRLSDGYNKQGYETNEYKEKYAKYKGKKWSVAGLTIYPIYGIKTQNPMNLKKKICNYTKEGREIIHQKLGYINENVLKYLIRNPIKNQGIEFNDNRLSKYVAQKGMCPVSKQPLGIFMEAHHITPKHMGGTDEYKNIVIVTYEVHKLIHATKQETIQEYLNIVKLDKAELEKLNKYRIKVGNDKILSD